MKIAKVKNKKPARRKNRKNHQIICIFEKIRDINNFLYYARGSDRAQFLFETRVFDPVGTAGLLSRPRRAFGADGGLPPAPAARGATSKHIRR